MRIALALSVILNLLLAGALYLNVQVLDMIFGPQRHDRRQSQFEAYAEPKGGVVFVGDSITHGAEWNELFGRTALYNRGIGGDTTTGVLARIDSVIALAPERLFLMIGVNDLNSRQDGIAERYDRILQVLGERLPSTRVYVQSVLPVTEDWMATDNASIDALNVEIQSIASRRGLPYIDLHSLFEDETGALRSELTNDGIHLMAEGYAIWRDAIREQVAGD